MKVIVYAIGGVILVHDYFLDSYAGVKVAVDEFARKEGINFMPIGDGLSVVLQK